MPFEISRYNHCHQLKKNSTSKSVRRVDIAKMIHDISVTILVNWLSSMTNTVNVFAMNEKP